MTAYRCRQAHRTELVDVRGINYAVHCWGSSQAQPVFLLHGWADTGRSFQFLADELSRDFFLIAPDWRGFGDSGWSSQGYWFPDYLGDLDALVRHFSTAAQVDIVGHSMGGNVACLYAGAKPGNVRRMVILDVYGLPATTPGMAPDRYAKWLEQLNSDYEFSRYDSLDKLAQHIIKLAPGLSPERALFIAECWGKSNSETSEILLKADPAHKRVNPVLYRREEARACWQNIEARCLFIYGSDSRMYHSYTKEGYREEFIECIRHFDEQVIENASHMLHLQQPAELARRLEAFLP